MPSSTVNARASWVRIEETYPPRNMTTLVSTSGPFVESTSNYFSSMDAITKSDLRRTVRQLDGWRDPTPYDYTRITEVPLHGEYISWTFFSNDSTRSLKTGTVSAEIASINRSIPAVPAGLVNRAVAECLIKLKDQNVNYAVAMAEGRKTLGLVAGSIVQVARALSCAKRLRWAEAARILKISNPVFKKGQKDVAGRWLELQYGWLPLLSDMHGALEDLEKGLDRVNPRISVSRTIKTKINRTWSEKSFFGITVHYRETGYVGVKVRLDYAVDNPGLAKSAKIGITNPLVVAWELVPFSFVLDWLVPIGSWLSALDADFGLRFIGGTSTSFSKIRKVVKTDYVDLTAPYIGGYNRRVEKAVSTGSFDAFKMSRSVFTSTPLASIYVKNPFSTGHALNSLALLRRLIK